MARQDALHPVREPRPGGQVLTCRAGRHRCALPLQSVVETMRPLPVRPLPGAPAFVRGLAVVRGDLVPVIDLGTLLLAGPEQPERFVSVRAGDRPAALATGAVTGVRSTDDVRFDSLPPVLSQLDGGVVTQIGLLDADVLLLLAAARLVPDAVWAAVDGQEDGQEDGA